MLTVVAGPQQTLKELSLQYVGHFDSELSKKIRSLNPDLKDPDHLEAGTAHPNPLASRGNEKSKRYGGSSHPF